MKTVSIAFVGIGGYGAVNLNSARGSGRKDIRIVATVDPFNRAEGLDCPHFATLAEMFAANIRPDLTVISTPIQFHTEQIIECLKNGSNVMCEKPITGDIADLPLLEAAEKQYGKFVAIGYQWSYSKSIQALKADILSGTYGKPVFLKTLILWPRDKAYFSRSTGWAGKIRHGGKLILDSVMNNATAHYLHNILYLLGADTQSSARADNIRATLLRTNPIETFDTVTAKFSLPHGAEGLFIASHVTDSAFEPTFCYEFENGSISYSEEMGSIVGKLKDGTEKNYGDPFHHVSDKIFTCADMVLSGETDPICGIRAASAQAEFIAKLHEVCPIRNANPEKVCETEEKYYVPALRESLLTCYEKNLLLEEIEKELLV